MCIGIKELYILGKYLLLMWKMENMLKFSRVPRIRHKQSQNRYIEIKHICRLLKGNHQLRYIVVLVYKYQDAH